MDSVDAEVLSSVLTALRAGRDVWLCTVVATYGSSPRPVGSLFAYDGVHTEGSLSGGCVEEELLVRLDTGDMEVPAIIQYGVSRTESERLGLPCGGTLDVLVERLVAGDGLRMKQVAALVDALEQRQCLQRSVALDSGEWQLQPIDRHCGVALEAGQLLQSFGPRYQLLLVGAGELARWVARFAVALDYRVRVTDPRSDKLEQWDVEGVERVGGMPDDAVRRFGSDAYSIVITLTHDPRIDDMALMEALTTEAFYVGALGSQRTSAARRQRLQQLDLPPEAIGRLHAPVGLSIGSKRPPEIAIAILAELTRLRSQREASRRQPHAG